VKGESLIDTAKTLGAMNADVAVVRHRYSGAAQLFQNHIAAKVINAGDGKHQHPTQTLLDLLTIYNELTDMAVSPTLPAQESFLEKNGGFTDGVPRTHPMYTSLVGETDARNPESEICESNANKNCGFMPKNSEHNENNVKDATKDNGKRADKSFFNASVFKGVKLGILGDLAHSRVANSLLSTAIKLGMQVVYISPKTLMPSEVQKWGAEISYDLDKTLPELDVLCVLRMQFERIDSNPLPSIAGYSKFYQINAERASTMKKEAFIIHPGPVNRGIEMSSEVVDSKKCKILDQVQNGVAVRSALLCMLLGKEI
jgi:aspartate carbamoyltransferase catalytic subunit